MWGSLSSRVFPPRTSTTTNNMRSLVKQVAAVDVGGALGQLTKLHITAEALDEVMAVLTSSSDGRQRDGAEPGCVTLAMIKRNLPKLVGEGKKGAKTRARTPSEISPKKKAVLAEKLARIVREEQQNLGLRHWSRCLCGNYRFTRYFWILHLQQT